MEEKERSQGDTRRPEEDTGNSVEDTGRVIQRKYRKIPEIFCPNGGYFENQDKMRGLRFSTS
jgi:hypothetical protein